MGTPVYGTRSYFSYEILGLRLAKARNKAAFTQESAAEALAVSQTWISKSENGTRKIGVFDLVAMAELYGVRITEFLGPATEDEMAALEERLRTSGDRQRTEY
jgi:transcriptional regulator with XRE-family HTH domain